MLVWIYLVGLVVGFRVHAGAIFHEFTDDTWADPEDYLFAVLFGLLTMWLWPLTFAGRAVYVLAKKYGPEDTEFLTRLFFPSLREVESRHERNTRIAREAEQRDRDQQRTIAMHRARIAELEREVGIVND